MPIPSLSQKDFGRVIEAVKADYGIKKAWVYVAEGKAVIRACRRFKENARNSRGELLVTYGAPNFAERRLLKSLSRRGEAIPKNVQARPWPVKKKVVKKTKKR